MRFGIVIATWLFSGGLATAAEITVISGGAIEPGLHAATHAFEKETGHHVKLTFNRASTGLYFEDLLKKWGIYAEVEKKTTRYPDGASVMEHALKGKGREIAFGAITGILLYKEKGLRYIGPIPADVQNYTSYIATPMNGGKHTEVAKQYVQFLGSPAGKKLFVGRDRVADSVRPERSGSEVEG